MCIRDRLTGLQKEMQDQATTNGDQKQLQLKDHGKYSWQDLNERECDTKKIWSCIH